MSEFGAKFVYRWLALPLATLGFFLVALFSPRTRKTARLHFQSLREFSLFLMKFRDLERQGPTILFHASSVGEFLQAEEVATHMRQKFPEYRLVLSFFSSSLLEWRDPKSPQSPFDFTFPYPWDFPFFSKRILDNLLPKALIFSKTDIWPELVWQASNRRIPIFLASATLGTESGILKNKVTRFFYRNILKNFEALFVVNIVVKNLFEKMFSNFSSSNRPRIEILGDPKVDSALARKLKPPIQHRDIFNKIQEWREAQKSPLWVLGSVWPDDLNLLLTSELQKEIHLKKTRLLVIPHETDHETQRSLKNFFTNKGFRNFTSIDSNDSSANNLNNFDIIFLFKKGILAHAYSLGEFAYVGCGKGGLHNIFEPLVWGKPTFFGPYFSNAPEARELLNRGAVESLKTGTEWDLARRLVQNFGEVARTRSQIAQAFIEESRGASLRTTVRLENWLTNGKSQST